MTATTTEARADRLMTATSSSAAQQLLDAVEPGNRGSGVSGDEIEALRLLRDILRIRFLKRPAAFRQAIAGAEEKRRTIRRLEAKALQSRREAESAAQAAEDARRTALEEARLAETEALKALATERVRIESLRGRVAEVQASLALDQAESSARASLRLTDYEQWLSRSRREDLDPSSADQTYDEVTAELDALLMRLRRQLAVLVKPPSVPRIPAGLDYRGPTSGALSEEVADLQTALRDVVQEAESVISEERYARWQGAEILAVECDALSRLRLKLAESLSPEKYSQQFGLTAAGVEELRREVTQLALMGRWYLMSTLRSIRTLPVRLRDPGMMRQVAWASFKVLLLTGALLMLRRRARGWIISLRQYLTARLKSRLLMSRVTSWTSFLLQNGRTVVFLILCYAVFRGEPSSREWALIARLVKGLAWYMFASAVVHHALTHRRRRRRRLSDGASNKILRSIRLVGRYVFVAYALLTTSYEIIGGGYLYSLIRGLSWLGAAIIAFVLLRRYKDDIGAAYLRLRPTGWFADAIRRSEGGSLGFFYAVAAFAVVSAQTVASGFSRLLLRFDQTRRALAYLFRRRLERKAEAAGRGSVDVEALPEPIREAFTEGPVEEEEAIDFWPHLDSALDGALRWYEEGEGVSFAVIGERGSGKTSWLRALGRALVPVETTYVSLERRCTSREAVIELFAEQLGTEKCTSEVSLSKQLLRGERRVVLVDNGQQLMLRTVGGTEGYKAFVDLIARTSHHVLWVVGFSKYSWSFIDKRFQGRNMFSSEIRLDGWPEERIAELIRERMTASGYEASFEELVLDQIFEYDSEDEEARTSDRYLRLLWDQAKGNPRVAIHFWKRSLYVDGTIEARVRLFAEPDVQALNDLEEESRFVLAAIMVHESLTLAEAARCLSYPVNVCQAALSHLISRKIIVRNEGRYRIPTLMYRAVAQFLVRQNLIQET